MLRSCMTNLYVKSCLRSLPEYIFIEIVLKSYLDKYFYKYDNLCIKIVWELFVEVLYDKLMHWSCVRSFHGSVAWQTYALKLCEKFSWKLCSKLFLLISRLKRLYVKDVHTVSFVLKIMWKVFSFTICMANLCIKVVRIFLW